MKKGAFAVILVLLFFSLSFVSAITITGKAITGYAVSCSPGKYYWWNNGCWQCNSDGKSGTQKSDTCKYCGVGCGSGKICNPGVTGIVNGVCYKCNADGKGKSPSSNPCGDCSMGCPAPASPTTPAPNTNPSSCTSQSCCTAPYCWDSVDSICHKNGDTLQRNGNTWKCENGVPRIISTTDISRNAQNPSPGVTVTGKTCPWNGQNYPDGKTQTVNGNTYTCVGGVIQITPSANDRVADSRITAANCPAPSCYKDQKCYANGFNSDGSKGNLKCENGNIVKISASSPTGSSVPLNTNSRYPYSEQYCAQHGGTLSKIFMYQSDPPYPFCPGGMNVAGFECSLSGSGTSSCPPNFEYRGHADSLKCIGVGSDYTAMVNLETGYCTSYGGPLGGEVYKCDPAYLNP